MKFESTEFPVTKSLDDLTPCDHDEEKFDVCIVGAGPAGLASLSALHSPYSLDGSTLTESQKERALKTLKNQKQRKVCVVDSGENWLQAWQSNFARLGIEYLRSPALAHPDLFDPLALLSYAVRHNREDELLESGCGDIKKLLALGQSQIGLWELPSTKLFVDFCLDLAKELPHSFVGGVSVVVIEKDKDSNKGFRLELSNGRVIRAGSVVLAVGTSGNPIVPNGIQNSPHWRHWTEPLTLEVSNDDSDNLPVMVVGGGLTAVQVALQELENSLSSNPETTGNHPRVILVSKRPLVKKHFDIDVQWFDHRTTNKCMADFYHNPMSERKRALREARRGGSVPPLYMEQIRQAEEDGMLLCLVGEIECGSENDSKNGKLVCVHHLPDRHEPNDDTSMSLFEVKEIVVACGMAPDCKKAGSLTSMIQSKWPTKIESGLPCVTQDLRWKEDLDLFVVGSMGALNIGPDAGNLMGIRRAAQIVANALGCRSWLRESVLANAFEALNWSDSDSDSDDDDDDFDTSDDEAEEQEDDE